MPWHAFRCAEVVEAACGIAPYLMGETLESVAGGIDCYSIRQPLGVVAGICPFNFPVSGSVQLGGLLHCNVCTLMQHVIWLIKAPAGPCTCTWASRAHTAAGCWGHAARHPACRLHVPASRALAACAEVPR